MSREEIAAYVREVEARRADQQRSLREFPSVLHAVARHELPIGRAVRFGGDTDADVPLTGIARTVTILATPEGFAVDGEPTGPRRVDAGRYALRLSHQGYPAVVVLDREAPLPRVRLRWYPVDPALRVRGRIVEDRAPLAIASTASADRRAERIGWLVFEHDGAPRRLAVTHLREPGVPEDHFDVYFRDATTGHGSYEVGRYVTVERDREVATIDFNRAYNPSCSLSPYYNCPIPPRENHLAIAIRAGEMTPESGEASHR